MRENLHSINIIATRAAIGGAIKELYHKDVVLFISRGNEVNRNEDLPMCVIVVNSVLYPY